MVHKRIGTWLLAALALAVASGALHHGFAGGEPPTAAGSAEAGAQLKGATPQNVTLPLHTDLARAQPRVSPVVAQHGPTTGGAHQVGSRMLEHNNARSEPLRSAGVDEVQPPTATNTDTRPSDADAIGRPFPLSQSLRDHCKQLARYGPDAICDEIHQALSTMAQEPVDPNWAPATEALLRARVTEAGEYTIRAVECRTTLCAIVVASVYGNVLLPYNNILSDKALEKDFDFIPAMTADEGGGVAVIFWCVRRRR
jgi:hypothetical protein